MQVAPIVESSVACGAGKAASNACAGGTIFARGSGMRVEDIMSVDPLQCRPETGLAEVARMMAEYDCGEIPVCDAAGKPLGVVTDRDIVCRMVAKGEDPRTHRAEECMSTPVVTAKPEMSIDECAGLMAQHQVRRLPVVDERGVCCGIVAQADLARKAPPATVANVLEGVSEAP